MDELRLGGHSQRIHDSLPLFENLIRRRSVKSLQDDGELSLLSSEPAMPTSRPGILPTARRNSRSSETDVDARGNQVVATASLIAENLSSHISSAAASLSATATQFASNAHSAGGDVRNRIQSVGEGVATRISTVRGEVAATTGIVATSLSNVGNNVQGLLSAAVSAGASTASDLVSRAVDAAENFAIHPTDVANLGQPSYILSVETIAHSELAYPRRSRRPLTTEMPEVLLANSTLTVTADDDIKIEAKMDLSALTLSTPGEKDLTELPVKSAETVLSSDDEGKVTDVQREEERLWTSEGKGPRPWKLYKADEVPDWLRERFILTGYRAYTTYVQNWRSIFRWHNETLNIHTHLIALIATAAAANALVMRLEPNADVWDRTVFSAYIAGAAFCFGASTLFHTHFPNSPEAFHTYCSLDTSGVSVLIMASTTIICYHFFYCQPVVRAVYIGLIIAANSVGILGPLWRAWTTPGFRSLRVAVFLGSAVLSCVPVFHYLIAYGFPPAGSWLLYAGLMVVFYLGGAFVYLMRFPERWSPGTFDYIGHSHTFWHCFIVAAAWSHYCCAIELHRWRVGGEYCAHP